MCNCSFTRRVNLYEQVIWITIFCIWYILPLHDWGLLKFLRLDLDSEWGEWLWNCVYCLVTRLGRRWDAILSLPSPAHDWRGDRLLARPAPTAASPIPNFDQYNSFLTISQIEQLKNSESYLWFLSNISFSKLHEQRLKRIKIEKWISIKKCCWHVKRKVWCSGVDFDLSAIIIPIFQLPVFIFMIYCILNLKNDRNYDNFAIYHLMCLRFFFTFYCLIFDIDTLITISYSCEKRTDNY